MELISIVKYLSYNLSLRMTHLLTYSLKVLHNQNKNYESVRGGAVGGRGKRKGTITTVLRTIR